MQFTVTGYNRPSTEIIPLNLYLDTRHREGAPSAPEFDSYQHLL